MTNKGKIATGYINRLRSASDFRRKDIITHMIESETEEIIEKIVELLIELFPFFTPIFNEIRTTN